jgi:hypothetical protein
MNAEEIESDESVLWRPPPQVPYVRPDRVLTVPLGVLNLTMRVFQQYAGQRVESACFWYGTRDDAGNGRVAAVAVPRQYNHWGHYRVEADGVAAMAAATRPHGWKNLSQVHTHPGPAVEHSRYDDAHANSRRALSLVFPLYGLWRGRWPAGVGVHEFHGYYWHLLAAADAAARVLTDATDLKAQLVDTRR